jgi:hypothetical protein
MPFDTVEPSRRRLRELATSRRRSRELASLVRARRLIRYSWLWRQDGEIGFLTQSRCALNAVVAVADDFETRLGCYRALARHIPLPNMLSLAPADWLVWFNDDPRTKHSDVLAMFDAAIAEHLP